MTTPVSTAIRASDADRDTALGLLRDHWLAGRLTLDEYEERCAEAAAGRFLTDLERALRELPYPLPEHAAAPSPTAPSTPAHDHAAGAVLALVLGVLSLLGIVLSLGMLFLLTLPASTWAWSLGHRSRRGTRGAMRVIAGAAETLGIVATVIGCLALTACGAMIAA